MDSTSLRADRDGIALIITILVLVAVAAIAAAAATLSMNAQLIAAAEERHSLLEDVAEAGLELGRARINGLDDAMPTTGYATLESSATVHDASGNVIPGVRRSLYVGPRGISTGQYGVFASIVSVAEGPRGEQVVVRRADVLQESFARFAYFTDVEPSNIAFGGGDQIFGPVHSNDRIRVYSSGATFHGPVATAQDVSGAGYADFRQGVTEYAPAIPMPTTADLDKLQALAADGGMAFTAAAGGSAGQATLRLEFVALDVNGDGDATDPDEGFLMAYRSADARWVVAGVPAGGLTTSPNCGHYHQPGDVFVAVTDHPSTTGPDSKLAALSNVSRRCFLGGHPELSGGVFDPDDGVGEWVEYPGEVSTTLTTRFGALADYLFPLSRSYNPEFKGVVHVTGKVAVSGTVRGRVTLAATDRIILVDDLVYATDPAAPGREATCDDLVGLFSGDDVLVADNSLNAPVRPAIGQNWFTYDDTRDEFIHGTVLALEQFTVENYAGGDDRAERCEGRLWGRGCLYLTGGIIQRQRGAVGTISSPGGTGYLKRYSYDRCAATMPPPYFPTTGHYSRDQQYNVESVNFDIGAYFALLAPEN